VRGIATIPSLHLCSRFPFGFFVARTEQRLTTTIVTHPAPEPADEQARGRGRNGDAAWNLGARSPSVAGLRPFRTGDALADVHWKATARRGVPILKEREREADRAQDLVLDRRCAPEAFEAALSTATAHVLSARDRGQTLRLHSQDTLLVVGNDRPGEAAALRWLAAAAALPQSAPPPPNPPGATRLPARRAVEVAT
jgi:uncharacterized protein (DUF58 family)